MTIYNNLIKRMFDFTMAIFLLTILSPLFLIIWVLVRCNLGAPAVFKQARPGFGEKIFTIYKFRTMLNTFSKNGDELPDEQRLTEFGRFLRSTSLDEIPQLWNVLKGDISFIGPRALLVEYLPLYNDEQKLRHSVRPGITGLAQINGRNAISWEDKFEYDCMYVREQSFILDMKIAYKTIGKVIRRQDVSSNGHVTMSKFTGTGGTHGS